MLWLKQSTSVVVQFGPFVDKTNGVDLEIGLATAMDNATTGIRLSKNGAAFADRGDGTVPAYDAMGCYRVTLSATDTGTLGTLRIIFEEAATCLPHWQDFMVVPANAYDSLVLGTDNIDANSAQVGGQTASATGAVDFDDLATIEADTTALNDTKIPDTLSLANINAEVDTAIETYGLDHLISSALPVNWATDVAANSVFDQLADDGTAAYDRTTDSLQAARDNVGAAGDGLTGIAAVGDVTNLSNLPTIPTNWLTADGIHADAVDLIWDEDMTTHLGSFKPGAYFTDIYTDTGTTIPGLLPTALVGDAIKADIVSISTSTTAADNLEASALGIIPGSVGSTDLGTTSCSTTLGATYAADELNGRVIVFTGGTALGQAATITDYVVTNAVVHFSGGVATAPVDGDTFVIV